MPAGTAEVLTGAGSATAVAASDVCAPADSLRAVVSATEAILASCNWLMLSVRARTLASCVWAAWAALTSTTSPPQAATVVRASSATPNHALRATGLSLRAGCLDVRPNLELRLEQRAARIVHGFGSSRI